MSGEFLWRTFSANEDKDAIVWNDRAYPYSWLLERMSFWQSELQRHKIEAGVVTAIGGDFSPNSVALFLALLQQACVLVPIGRSTPIQTATLLEIAQVETSLSLDPDDHVEVYRTACRASHPLYQELRGRGHPGLVLFSSGSTGVAKGVVHDLHGILKKFETPRQARRTIPFLLYDHIGGVNTILHVLSNGGCLVTVGERTPDVVLQAITRHRVELLPTSPTFINLILLSEAYQRHDLSSLKLVTYGTEPMPESTLQRFHRLFPHVQLQQTYGLSEVGILRSKSRSSESLWLKVGGEGFETRVVNGMLEIKADSAMLGYLNAPSPFTHDGWLQTGDVVQVDGEYIRILGRKSDIINVGGEKFFPAEVESVIGELEGVAEVTVYPEKNAILGNIVCARVRLKSEEATRPFIAQLKRHCRQRLAPFKVPVRVAVSSDPHHVPRFKKQRNARFVAPIRVTPDTL